MAIYNSDLLERDELVSCLEFYREEVQEFITGYERLEAFLKSEACSSARLAVAIRPRYQWEGVLKWTDEFLAALKT